MANTVAKFYWYDKAAKHLSFPGLLTDDIRVILLQSGYTPNAASHEYYDVSITNEHATASGYTSGGQALTTKTLTEASPGDWVFSSDDPLWTVATANLTVRLFALYNNTPASNKPLIGYGYLDFGGGTPADVTTVVGFPFSIAIPVGGWFTAESVNGA